MENNAIATKSIKVYFFYKINVQMVYRFLIKTNIFTFICHCFVRILTVLAFPLCPMLKQLLVL